MIEPAKLHITIAKKKQKTTSKQNKQAKITTGKQENTEEALLNVAEIIAEAGKTNPKQKQSKNIFQKSRSQKLTSNDE